MPKKYRSQPPRRRDRRRGRFAPVCLGALIVVLVGLTVWLFLGRQEGEGPSPMQSGQVSSAGGEVSQPGGEDGSAGGPAESRPGGEDSSAGAPPEQEPQEISLIMVGDILLHTPLQESGLQADGSYHYDHFFAHTKDLIAQADLALVNQEVILGGTELGLSGYPAFNGAFEVGDALVEAGFDVILHATNHALDKGQKGILNCLDFWRSSYPDIAVLGIHDSQESRDDNIYFYEESGITIAILNYTYGTNGIPLPEPYMVDLLEEEQVAADLQRASEQADFVIVAPHWGTEYTHVPTREQERWTQIFLENGVDLVLGTHPHVIEPVEWVEDGEGNRMLVYYSLGNFINFTSGSGNGVRQRAVGAMATVTLSVEEGEVAVSDYGVIPLVSHMVEGTGNPTVYPLSEYTQALAEENEMSKKDPGFTLDYCQELCREVFGALYRE